jgi:hypothetical protein
LLLVDIFVSLLSLVQIFGHLLDEFGECEKILLHLFFLLLVLDVFQLLNALLDVLVDGEDVLVGEVRLISRMQ